MPKGHSAVVGDDFDFQGVEVTNLPSGEVELTVVHTFSPNGRRSRWTLERHEAEELLRSLAHALEV